MNVRQLRQSVLRTAAIELLEEFPNATAEAEWLRARAEERPEYDDEGVSHAEG